MNVFEVQGAVMLLVLLALLVLKGYAFISSLRYPADAYEAAGKLTKPAWAAITGLGFATQVFFAGSVFNILGIIFTIAAIVYIVDVKPALAEVTSHRR